MSRYLAFWKYEDGVNLNHQEVYEKVCCNELAMNGLVELTIADILRCVNENFTDWDKLDDYNFESANGAFTIITTKQSVLFDCSDSMQDEDLNRLTDIMLLFDCPLYDPQIEVRFDGK